MSQEQEQAQSRLSELRAIDPAVLQEIVRQDQRRSDFEITEWSVGRLNEMGFASGDALFAFHGEGLDGKGRQRWSVVLKIVQAPDEEVDLRHLYYWKRELLLAQSGLLAHLSGPVRPPRIYGDMDYGTTGWVWMEHLVDASPSRWTLEEFVFAARQIGRDNAAYLAGCPLPDFPWLAQELVRYQANAILDYLDDPSVARALGPVLTRNLLQLWDERERFFVALNRLPHVFSHGDTQRRNLFIRLHGDQRELVAVDWAMCGLRAVGEELWNLVGSSTMLREWEPDAIADLEAAAYPAYVAGLQEAGWSGDPVLVRLGYIAAMALALGASIPLCIGYFGREEMRELDLRKFGYPPEELIRGWVTLEAYAQERADEARRIMDRMGW